MARSRSPDVLMLIIDDLRADLGSYGVSWARTPHMDALSRQGVTFLQAHASLANCAPSRSSLLTGLRPDTHGVLDLTTHVRDRHPQLTTLPQRFRAAGYLAVAYGKIFHQLTLQSPQGSNPQVNGRQISHRRAQIIAVGIANNNPLTCPIQASVTSLLR